MIKPILQKIFKKKKLTIMIGAGLILLISYFTYQKLTKDSQAARYVTAAVEKGSLIVSVSGSGQVSALDQVDISPQTSGELLGIYVSQDQTVKAGQLIAEIDKKSAQQAVFEAEIALEEAQEKLAELLARPDEQDLRQVEIALSQAKRDLTQAQDSYDHIEEDIADALADAYEQGYDTSANVFLNLSEYMDTLQDILGTAKYELDYIDDYELILSQNSLFIKRLINDYYQARDPFGKKYEFFISVFKDDSPETIYQLIAETIEITQAIAKALDSARHLFDAIAAGNNYEHLSIASQISKMKPKIESASSAVSNDLSSLLRIKKEIDETIKNAPQDIEDVLWTLELARNNYEDKKTAFEEMTAGPSQKDILIQENLTAQRQDAFLKAQEDLASCLIRAPFDGTVAETNSKNKKGDTVSPNTILATLITKQKIAKISLNEIDVAEIKTGQKAALEFDALENLSITGKVVEVDALGTVNQGVVTYDVKIAFDVENEQVKPGMSLSASIITNAKQDTLLIASSAIRYQGNSAYTQIVDRAILDNNTLSALANVSAVELPLASLKNQIIEIGLSNDTMTEVLSGLEEGDIIISQTITSNSSANQTQSSFGAGQMQMQGMMRMMR